LLKALATAATAESFATLAKWRSHGARYGFLSSQQFYQWLPAPKVTCNAPLRSSEKG